MDVLVACEYSGRVREAFRDKGHNVWSCDLLESEDNSPYHMILDLNYSTILEQPWDLIIAHPPCTYLANSGVRWLYDEEKGPERWSLMKDAGYFFADFFLANTKRLAVENPVMHKYGKDLIKHVTNDPDGHHDFSVQPWQFGDNFKKRTCFWTKNLPPLVPTSDLDGSTAYAQVHNEGPSKDRWKNRSRTYQGIAKAMAEQWNF